MAKLRISSAVVLTRGSGADLEIYLVERSPKLRFFGGFWACPGGNLDEEDTWSPGEDPALALKRCALRELFEETGVLPAALAARVDADGRAELRGELLEAHQSTPGWRALLEAAPEALEELSLVNRMTTPAFSPIRYRATFLHLELAPGEEPEIIPGELLRGVFQRPADFRQSWLTGERRIVPPVLLLLSWMQEEPELERFCARAQRGGRDIEAGVLTSVGYSPGIFAAPLETPTVPPATTTNTCLVGERSCYVVDPATWDESERARLFDCMDAWLAAGRRFEAVLSSHHHPDHVGSVVEVSQRYQLPVHAHPLTLERLPAGFLPGRALADGERLELGEAPDGTPGWGLEVYHTPGHDRGHLIFVETRYRAALAGDMVSTLSTILIEPPEGHLATYLASLERMLELDISMIYPSHGPVHPRGHELVRHFLEHRRKREEQLLGALGEEPRGFDELVPVVYADLPPESHPLAARSMEAGLEKLVEEGRARADGAGWRLAPAELEARGG